MRFIACLLSLFFLSIFSLELRSHEKNQAILKRYKMEDGLSSNRIFSIVQDSLGFLWFGTNDGLNRFDGISFKKYYYESGNPKSISSNSISCLHISYDNKMWISTDNGIDIYCPKTDSFTYFEVATSDGETISKRALEIIEDKDGDMWFASQSAGLYHYSRKDNTLEVYKNVENDSNSLTQNTLSTIFEDSEGTLWIGTYNAGLCSFSKETKIFTRYQKTADKNSLSDNSVRKIYEDSFGYLWIGTFQEGMDRLNPKTGEFVNFNPSNANGLLYHIQDIIEYRSGELLVGSDEGVGLFNITEGNLRYDADYNKQILPTTSKPIYKIFKDKEHSIWLGSYFQGVEYLPLIQDNFPHYSCERSSNPDMGKVIKAFYEGEKGQYWIGTDDDGIYVYDSVSDEVRPFRTAADINSSFYCITEFLLDDDKLFIGTYERGLEILDLNTKKVKSYLPDLKDENALPSHHVFTMFKSSSGRVYLGTANGLCYYNRKTDNFVRLEPRVRISSIVEDKHNNLWIATRNNGLYYYNIKKDEYKRYTSDTNDRKSLIRNVLSTLAYDSKGQLWIGSLGYGLCRYDEITDSFIRYEDLNLPNNVISRIICDENTLWISTNKGLARYDVLANQIKVFSKSSGLYNEQFTQGAGILTSKGQIMFGTADGFCLFNPYKLTVNQYKAPIVITKFTIYNETISPQSENSPLTNAIELTKNITLSHRQNMVGFEFASLSYLDPKENQYQYKLEGIDNEWNEISGLKRHISYTNLPSGNYTLQIKGTNNDKVWSSDEAVMHITITPHFLKSKTAIVLYVILFFFVLAFLIWYLLRLSERKHLEQIRQIEIKTQKEAYDSKVEFFTNIAHEIRTPLSLIIGPLEFIMRSRKINDQYGEHLTMIESNYQRLYSLVNQLLNFRKVDSGNYKMIYELCDLSKLIAEVVSLFNLAAQQKGIKIEVFMYTENLKLVTDKEALTKIMSNLVSNAMKYANKSILITAAQDEEKTSICVEDDGQGIATSERDNVFKAFYQVSGASSITSKGIGVGLYMTRSLVELMGGTISVSDRKNEKNGTLMLIELPKQEETRYQASMKDASDFFVDDRSAANIELEDIEDVEEDENTEEQDKKHAVMLVDDNPEILDFLSKILRADYFIISVSSGEEALKMLDNNQVDLIVSDIMMDGIDGLELCRRIKENINISHVPIVLLTAKADLETKIKGLEYGADAYIEKPFSPSHLKAQLANLIKKREELREKYTSSPLEEISITAHNRLDKEFVDKCTSFIVENITNSDFSIELLATEMGMSRTSMFTKLKAITGMTPNDFIKLIRLKTACKMMAEGEYRVTEVGYLVGFNSSSYFAKCFSKQFGMLPAEYMKSLKGEE